MLYLSFAPQQSFQLFSSTLHYLIGMSCFFLPNVILVVLVSLSLLVLAGGSMIEFDRVDIYSTDFDVDWGVSPSESDRLTRLKAFASTPLKGWNSYDGWDWSVTKKDVIGNIDYVAANLARFGYQIVTVDYFWSTTFQHTSVHTRFNTRIHTLTHDMWHPHSSSPRVSPHYLLSLPLVPVLGSQVHGPERIYHLLRRIWTSTAGSDSLPLLSQCCARLLVSS